MDLGSGMNYHKKGLNAMVSTALWIKLNSSSQSSDLFVIPA